MRILHAPPHFSESETINEMISQPQASILRAEEQHPRSILMQGRNNNNCILTDGTFVSDYFFVFCKTYSHREISLISQTFGSNENLISLTARRVTAVNFRELLHQQSSRKKRDLPRKKMDLSRHFKQHLQQADYQRNMHCLIVK